MSSLLRGLSAAAAEAANVLLPAVPPEPPPALPPAVSPARLQSRLDKAARRQSSSLSSSLRHSNEGGTPISLPVTSPLESRAGDLSSPADVTDAPVRRARSRRNDSTPVDRTASAVEPITPLPTDDAPAAAFSASATDRGSSGTSAASRGGGSMETLSREQLVTLCSKVTKRMQVLERRTKASKATLSAAGVILDTFDTLVAQLTAQTLSAFVTPPEPLDGDAPPTASNTAAAGEDGYGQYLVSNTAVLLSGVAGRLGLDTGALSEAIFGASGKVVGSGASSSADSDDGRASEVLLKATLAGGSINVSRLRSAIVKGALRAKPSARRQQQRKASTIIPIDGEMSSLRGSTTDGADNDDGDDSSGNDEEDGVFELQSRLASSGMQLRRLQHEIATAQRSHEDAVKELVDRIAELEAGIAASHKRLQQYESGGGSSRPAGRRSSQLGGDSEIHIGEEDEGDEDGAGTSENAGRQRARTSSGAASAAEIDAFRRRSLASEAQIGLLQRRVEEAEAALEEAVSRAESAESALSSERSASVTLRAQAMSTSDALAEAEKQASALRQQLLESKAQLSAVTSRAASAEAALNSGAHEVELQALRSRVAQLSASAGDADRRVAEAAAEAASLRSQVEALQSDIALRSSRARALIGEKDKEIATLQGKVRDLQASIREHSGVSFAAPPLSLSASAGPSLPSTPFKASPFSPPLTPVQPPRPSISEEHRTSSHSAAEAIDVQEQKKLQSEVAMLSEEMADLSRQLELARSQESALKAEIRRLQKQVEVHAAKEAVLTTQLEGALAVAAGLNLEYLRNVVVQFIGFANDWTAGSQRKALVNVLATVLQFSPAQRAKVGAGPAPPVSGHGVPSPQRSGSRPQPSSSSPSAPVAANAGGHGSHHATTAASRASADGPTSTPRRPTSISSAGPSDLWDVSLSSPPPQSISAVARTGVPSASLGAGTGLTPSNSAIDVHGSAGSPSASSFVSGSPDLSYHGPSSSVYNPASGFSSGSYDYGAPFGNNGPSYRPDFSGGGQLPNQLAALRSQHGTSPTALQCHGQGRQPIGLSGSKAPQAFAGDAVVPPIGRPVRYTDVDGLEPAGNYL